MQNKIERLEMIALAMASPRESCTLNSIEAYYVCIKVNTNGINHRLERFYLVSDVRER